MKEPKLLDFKIEQSIVQNGENKIIKRIIKPNKNNKTPSSPYLHIQFMFDYYSII
jgi:hypothetical protein